MAAGLTERQLDAIAETLDLAQQLGAEIWLRGGWAMDFLLGEIPRDQERAPGVAVPNTPAAAGGVAATDKLGQLPDG